MSKFNTTQIDEMKAHLPDYAEDMLTKSKGKDKYVCPFCDSGTLKNKTGALTIYPTNFYCFSCGKSGDIFDLVAEVEHIAKNKVIQYTAKKYNIYSDDTDNDNSVDYTDFYRDCNKHLQDTTYHRGISVDTLNRFLVGFVPNWQHPKSPQSPPTPRLIIPTSRTSYLARDTRKDDEIPKYQKKYTKSKVGSVHIFNEKTLSEISVFYIVEGELDALSVIDVGFNAVGLGGVSNVAKFFKTIDKNGKSEKQKFIVALDNDTAGKKTVKALQDGFKERKLSYCIYNPCDKYKDCNEALNADRDKFRQAIQYGIDNFDTLAQSDTGYYNSTGKKPPFTIELLQQFLNAHGISIRENVITHEIEAENLPKEYDFDGSSSHLGTILYSELKKSDLSAPQNAIENYIMVIAKQHSYNPVAEILKGKTWDGKDRFVELFEIMHITDTFQRELIVKWLMQSLSVTLYNSEKEPISAEGVLVLVGEQAVGKTSLVRKLGISNKLCKTGLSLDCKNKDSVITAVSCFIGELGELESTFKSDISALKAFFTQEFDTLRKPYGRSYEKVIRRATYIATCNSKDFLIDETGNRRYWTIDCPQRFDLDELQKFDEIQLWLQVYDLIQAKGKQAFRLSFDELQQLNEQNLQHEKKLKAQAEIEDILSYSDGDTFSGYYKIEYRPVTISEFRADWLTELRSYSVHTIGKALDKLGIEQKKIRKDGTPIKVRLLPLKVAIK